MITSFAYTLARTIFSILVVMSSIACANNYGGPDWGPLYDNLSGNPTFILPAHRGGSWTAILNTEGLKDFRYVTMSCMTGGTTANVWASGASHTCPPGSELRITAVDQLWVGWTGSGESILTLDPPVITTMQKGGPENTNVTFSLADFTNIWSDPNDYPLAGIKIKSLPSHGTLIIFYEGEYYSLSVDTTVTEDLLGDVSFVPETNWSGTTSFEWSGFNSLVWSSEASVNINIVSPNSPTVSSISKSGAEDTPVTFSATDFTGHFTDPNGDDLTKIEIISLPSHGTLKLSEDDVAVNQEIVIGNIENLTFVPDTDWNGDTSFSWNGSDGTAYAAIAANVDITIAAVPDAPTVSAISKSGIEDTVLTFTATDFTSHFTDPDGDDLTKIQIISLPSHGTLKLSEGNVVVDQEIAIGDIENLTFVPDAGWSGDTGFSWNGSDGTAYAASAANVDITIIHAVNQLSLSLVGSLDTENDAFEVAIAGDYAYVTDGDNGLKVINVLNPTDPVLVGSLDMGGRAIGITIVGVYAYVTIIDKGLRIINISDPTNPILVGSLDTGGGASGVTVTGIYAYVADGDYGLKIINISDPTNPILVGSLGTVAVMRLTVTGSYAYGVGGDGLKIIDISDPTNPILVGSLDIEDFAVTVAVAGDYAYVSAGDRGLKIIKISNPANPVLVKELDIFDYVFGISIAGDYAYVMGVSTESDVGLKVFNISFNPSDPVLVGSLIDTAVGFGMVAVAAGDCVYVPTPSYVNPEEVGALKIIRVQYPPVVSAIPKKGVENTIMTFNASDFISHFSDANGDSLTKVDIISLPSPGGLKLLEDYVVVNQEIDVANLSGLTFEPETNWRGITSFGWNGYGGGLYSDRAANVDIAITAIPVVTTISKSGTEDTPVTFSATDFTSHFADPDGDNLTKIQIISLPSHGTPKLSGENVVVNQEIVVGDIENLTFVPDADWSGDTSFSWNGSDGTAYAASAANVDITIVAVPDAPIVSAISKLGTEDTVLTFTAADFTSHFSDVDGDSLTKIKVVSLPSNGTLKLLGTAVTESQEIAVANLDTLTFDPTTNWNGNTSFSWNGSDGAAYAASAANVDITIAAVPDAPTVSAISKLGTEDTVLTFTAADFTSRFTDPDGDNLTKIKIISLPNHGTPKLSGEDVVVDQEIAIGDIENLTFVPDTGWSGDTSFSWNGSDGTAYASDAAIVEVEIASASSTNWGPAVVSVVPVVSVVIVSGCVYYIKKVMKKNLHSQPVSIDIPMNSVV
jgi:large repetitive protein